MKYLIARSRTIVFKDKKIEELSRDVLTKRTKKKKRKEQEKERKERKKEEIGGRNVVRWTSRWVFDGFEGRIGKTHLDHPSR